MSAPIGVFDSGVGGLTVLRALMGVLPAEDFLYLGDTHREGLAMLVYAVRARKGFVVLTGEVGTGKTTLLHALLGQLDSEMPSAFIFNPRLEPLDFFHVLFDEFGIDTPCRTKAEYLLTLNRFLIECLKQDKTALLIIDEAQNLNLEAIEEMRMLSNFQFDQHALLQSFLVGQPELRKLLQTKSME